MAGLLVDVKLEVLVVVHEAAPGLVDGQMQRVLEMEVMARLHGVLSPPAPPGESSPGVSGESSPR